MWFSFLRKFTVVFSGTGFTTCGYVGIDVVVSLSVDKVYIYKWEWTEN